MRTLNLKNSWKIGLQIKVGMSFFLLLVACLQACSRSTIQNQPHRSVVVMGVSADYPPFEYNKEGRIVGFDIDVARELATEAGFALEIQDIDFSALIPSLQSGRIDFVMSGMTINEERKRNIDFSEPYYQSSFAMIISKESTVSDGKDVDGKKIGVQLGSTMEKFAKEQSKIHPKMEVVSLSRNPVLIQELKANRLDGVIVEEVQASEFIKFNPTLKSIGISWAGEGYAIAFPKHSPKGNLLKSQLNQALEKLQRTGKLAELKKKWLVKE